MFTGRGLTDEGLAAAAGRRGSAPVRDVSGGGADWHLASLVAHEEKLVLATAIQLCKMEAETIAGKISAPRVFLKVLYVVSFM
jgi:hypothetical protein